MRWNGKTKALVSNQSRKAKIGSTTIYSRLVSLSLSLLFKYKLSSSSQPTLIITSYGLVQSVTGDFLPDEDDEGDCFWDYVVLDEAHLIKNKRAKRTQCCHKICSNPNTKRMMLTGTPIMNNLTVRWRKMEYI